MYKISCSVPKELFKTVKTICLLFFLVLERAFINVVCYIILQPIFDSQSNLQIRKIQQKMLRLHKWGKSTSMIKIFEADPNRIVKQRALIVTLTNRIYFTLILHFKIQNHCVINFSCVTYSLWISLRRLTKIMGNLYPNTPVAKSVTQGPVLRIWQKLKNPHLLPLII